MGIAEIEKRILDEAEAEAGKIKAEAEKGANQIEAEAKKRADDLRRQILAEAEIKAQEEKKSLIVPARLNAKKRILEEKQKMLDEVYAGVSPEIREKKEIEVAKVLYG